MELLNELYNQSCKPKCESYTKISNDIILIDNFFENFEFARDFFTGRDKWKCIPYQEHSKPGYESVFPKWIGKSLLEKFVLDNKISDDMNSYEIVCNFFYDEKKFLWSLSNSNYFPHIDSIKNNNILQYICLINLNNIPVSTKFYTYKNQQYCSSEMETEWDEYNKDIIKQLFEYYNKKTITRNEAKIFLDTKQDLGIKLIKEVDYKPNQAIVYSANLFHSPNVPQEFTKDKPRVLLRITFDRKIIEPEKSSNIHKTMKITIPISIGELLDKISILSIKSQHTKNEYVKKELQDLIKIAQEQQVYDTSYVSQLLQVNRKLWKIEDDLRVLEKSQTFNQDFIELARSVYITNDERARIKKEINEKYKSTYQEVKCYV